MTWPLAIISGAAFFVLIALMAYFVSGYSWLRAVVTSAISAVLWTLLMAFYWRLLPRRRTD